MLDVLLSPPPKPRTPPPTAVDQADSLIVAELRDILIGSFDPAADVYICSELAPRQGKIARRDALVVALERNGYERAARLLRDHPLPPLHAFVLVEGNARVRTFAIPFVPFARGGRA